MPMLPITPMPPPKEDTLPTGQDVPKEFAVYQRLPSDFLPPGKTFNDLTPEEKQTLQNQYRFSPFKPGKYQAITGYSTSY
jgi:hypothetical protein